MINPPISVETIANNLYETLAQSFPVSCSSDEFFYFPQVLLPEQDWSIWDSFSSDTVIEIAQKLSAFEDELSMLMSLKQDMDTQIDIALLQKLIRTLQEQLVQVRAWETQPSLYLTIACIGLAEAMESEDSTAKYKRAKSLPDFLENAIYNLNRVPVLFRNIGLEMLKDTRNYFALLKETIPELKIALIALDRFEDALRNVSMRKDFLVSQELLKRILNKLLPSILRTFFINPVNAWHKFLVTTVALCFVAFGYSSYSFQSLLGRGQVVVNRKEA